MHSIHVCTVISLAHFLRGGTSFLPYGEAMYQEALRNYK